MAHIRHKPPVTIQAIARRAGVSHATVSLVLNDRGRELRINPDTQQRVLDIAKKLNYVPNHLARGLSGKRTHTIGVLWSLGGPHATVSMARNIAMEAQNRGYVTYLTDTLSDAALMGRALTDFAQRRVDGVVMQLPYRQISAQAELIRQMEAFPAAVAVIAGEDPLDTRADCLIHARGAALMEAVDHLVAIGRRRLAFLGEAVSNATKISSLQQACRRHSGLHDLTVIDSPHSPTLRNEDFWQALGRAAAKQLSYDALICSSDEVAAAALGWLRLQGRRVPEDVAIVGFNDSNMAPFLTPPLASIAREDETVAQAIGQMLFRRLDDPDLPPQRTEVRMRFVWRPSAGGSAQGQP